MPNKIDLISWGEKYIHQRGYVEEEYRRNKKIREDPEAPARAQKAVEDMAKTLVGSAESNKKYYEFCEELEEKLNALILKFYPEILESEPEYIKEMGRIIYYSVYDTSSRISDLANKARKS